VSNDELLWPDAVAAAPVRGGLLWPDAVVAAPASDELLWPDATAHEELLWPDATARDQLSDELLRPEHDLDVVVAEVETRVDARRRHRGVTRARASTRFAVAVRTRRSAEASAAVPGTRAVADLPASCPSCDGALERGCIVGRSVHLDWSPAGEEVTVATVAQEHLATGTVAHPPELAAARCTACGLGVFAAT
jgi:hypothetical protein